MVPLPLPVLAHWGRRFFFAYLFHICSGKNAGISTVFGNGTDGTDKILLKIKI
jgi:hypothetical protein